MPVVGQQLVGGHLLEGFRWVVFEVVPGADPRNAASSATPGSPYRSSFEPEEGFPLSSPRASVAPRGQKTFRYRQSEFDGDDVSGHEQKA